MHHRPVHLTLLLIGTLLLLQGCGFQLRGTSATSSSLPSGISPIYIQGPASGDLLKVELETLLHSADAEATNDPTQAASKLRISDRTSNRRVLSVDGNGKVLEFELNEGLSFDLVDAAGVELVPRQRINVTQSYINAEVQVLGKQQEEQFLREGMWQRMADQMIRRMITQLH